MNCGDGRSAFDAWNLTNVPAGAHVTVVVTPSGGLDATLDANGDPSLTSVIAFTNLAGANGAETGSFVDGILDTNYKIFIGPSGGTSGSYTLQVTLDKGGATLGVSQDDACIINI